jgi:hypothetical protein
MDNYVDTQEFQMTLLCSENGDYKKRSHEVAGAVKHFATEWSTQRSVLEDEWRDCWAEYFSNDRGSEMLRQVALQKVGDVDMNWRHKVPTGKALEVVETVNSYLQAAFFPNKQWFDLYPKSFMDSPEWQDVLQVLVKYIAWKLEDGNFRDFWDVFCRQMLVTGTSVLALPWRYETQNTFKNVKNKKGKYVPEPVTKVVKNGLDFEVVDMFDFYLDPQNTQPRQGACIRRLVKTKGEVIRMIESGVYPLGDKQMVEHAKSYTPSSISSSAKSDIKYLNGFMSDGDPRHRVELYEYWGNLVVDDVEFIDVCCITMGDELLMFKPNPYWGGKPFVIGTLTNTHDSPYGTGILQPILGQLHTLFITSNHRLDCGELAINPMWLVVNDGSIDLNEMYSGAGRVIPVEDVETSVRPLETQSNTMVAIQDEQLLESRIDKITGVGAYVGVNGGRQAERVTAEEVKSQRDAGGNRLGRYHKHIEDTALNDLLKTTYAFMQQFVIDEETVRIERAVQTSMSDKYEFFTVGQEDLQYDLDIIPIGSDHIIDKEFELQQRLDFYTVVSQNPDMAKYVNWKEAMKDLARRMMKQDWERFIVIPEEGEAQAPPQGQGQQQPSMEEQMMMEQQAQAQKAANPTGNPDADQYIRQLAQNPEQAAQTVANVSNNDRSLG